jgi:hypothetical protein
MTSTSRRAALVHGALAVIFMSVPAALAQDRSTSLFKIVTVRDDIVVGFDTAELARFGGDAGGIAAALKKEGTLSAWQYAVKRGASGDLEQAPLRKVGLIAHDTLRVEPYATPQKVLPHE